MARPPHPPASDPDTEDTEPGFAIESDTGSSDEEPPPFLAAGTQDDLAEHAHAARTVRKVDDDVASLAHDLKNPLTIIMLETGQIEQRLGARLTPAVQQGLERIAQNAAYIDRLVSDLLDLTSHEAGRLDLRLDKVDLARLLQSAVGRAVPSTERQRVHLDVRDTVFVQADETRIERVVANLVSNALKYSEGLVTVRLDTRGAMACVSVLDHGPGLTADESRVVFERYRRASTTQEGYGLGLYTSRRIVEAHRGRIGLASQPGRGSRFFFELPLVR